MRFAWIPMPKCEDNPVRENCVTESCIYVHNAAIATGVLPHNGKQNNWLLLIWWTPKAEVTGSTPVGRAIKSVS